MRVLKYRTTSLLMFRGLPMGSALSKRHAPHPNSSQGRSIVLILWTIFMSITRVLSVLRATI